MARRAIRLCGEPRHVRHRCIRIDVFAPADVRGPFRKIMRVSEHGFDTALAPFWMRRDKFKKLAIGDGTRVHEKCRHMDRWCLAGAEVSLEEGSVLATRDGNHVLTGRSGGGRGMANQRR